jgi:hypothetical protein
MTSDKRRTKFINIGCFFVRHSSFAVRYVKGLIAFITLVSLACVRLNLAPPPQPAEPPTQMAVRPPPTPQSSANSVSVAKLSQTLKITPQPACFLPDVETGQHISASGSYTLTERAVSTPMQCHQARDSCGYHQLVGIVEPSIVFKQEEAAPFDTEDILMHPAMLQPLARLNQLVQAEWGGAYQLRVTDAYDSLLEHDPPDSEPSRRYSLHYEGRAIDLTLWPVDYRHYGRLCALAHCAGFDWVLNEVTHCHASIKAESLCEVCGK